MFEFEISHDELLTDMEDIQFLSSVDDNRPLKVPRNSCIFRKRWDSYYLRNLAIQEGSFMAEYRLDPAGFDILVELLHDQLSYDIKMADVRKCGTKCEVITPDSRLGAYYWLVDENLKQ